MFLSVIFGGLSLFEETLKINTSGFVVVLQWFCSDLPVILIQLCPVLNKRRLKFQAPPLNFNFEASVCLINLLFEFRRGLVWSALAVGPPSGCTASESGAKVPDTRRSASVSVLYLFLVSSH